VHVSDLTLPEGVTVVAHGKDQTVATSSIPRGAAAAETAAE
jgi:large subunit ribosomal protein L25